MTRTCCGSSTPSGARGLQVGSVVITQYAGQPAADAFQAPAGEPGRARSTCHYPIEGYPHNIALIVSDEGYGKNEYMETTRPLVVVTAPGPGSGKMATCLSQLYHEYKRGVKAGYAKFETFPIWNLPLKHPVNLAYEAATADLDDVNMIDPFHLQAYGETTVNYNRDVEVFPVLSAMFEKIMGQCPYKSPTDMGVNMAGNCIVDDEAVSATPPGRRSSAGTTPPCATAARARAATSCVYKLELLMQQAKASPPTIRPVIAAANRVAEETGKPAIAIELPDGSRGHRQDHRPAWAASSAALLNALKRSGRHRRTGVHLISPEAIEPIQTVKVKHLGSNNPRLHSDEMLIALAISATTDPQAAEALRAAGRSAGLRGPLLRHPVPGGRGHLSASWACSLTCEPQYQTNKLYHR